MKAPKRRRIPRTFSVDSLAPEKFKPSMRPQSIYRRAGELPETLPLLACCGFVFVFVFVFVYVFVCARACVCACV